MTNVEFIRLLTQSVRAVGAAATLDELRRTRPAFTDGAYHDTLAVFGVWAVERLIDAGLTDVAILWHPLTDRRSPLAWWDAKTLAGTAARTSFVPSTRALAHEPQPSEPRTLVVSGR